MNITVSSGVAKVKLTKTELTHLCRAIDVCSALKDHSTDADAENALELLTSIRHRYDIRSVEETKPLPFCEDGNGKSKAGSVKVVSGDVASK